MNRRGFLKALLGAAVAASMPVCGAIADKFAGPVLGTEVGWAEIAPSEWTVFGLNDPIAVRRYASFLSQDISRESYFSRKFLSDDGPLVPVRSA